MVQRNRGKQPNDDKYFASHWHPVLTAAIDDYCYLLSRDYAYPSALQVVGNRYKLNKRQRQAVLRISTSDQQVQARRSTVYSLELLAGTRVAIDGFNLLILLESALSGGYIFKGRDGTYRDISSVHGSYKRVQQTENAILLVGETLQSLQVEAANWYLDQPISNSGRLKTQLREISEANDFNWQIELVYNPDKVLAKSTDPVISTDGWILDQVGSWFNFSAFLFEGPLCASNILVL